MRGLVVAIAWILGLVVLAGVAGLVFFARPPVATPQALVEVQVCPPPVSIPPLGPGQPPDGLAGLRLGFTPAEVQASLDCLGEGYRYRTEPIWHTFVRTPEDGQKQILYAERGRESVAAGLIGAVEQERVYAIWRTLTYPPGEGPPKAELEAALLSDYGPAHEVEETRLRHIYTWAYDPEGRPLTKPAPSEEAMTDRLGRWFAERVSFPNCAKGAKLSPLERPTFNDRCGMTIMAVIEGDLNDPTKASSERAVLIDQARAARAVETFRAGRDVVSQ